MVYTDLLIYTLLASWVTRPRPCGLALQVHCPKKTLCLIGNAHNRHNKDIALAHLFRSLRSTVRVRCSKKPKMKLLKKQLPSPRVRLMELYVPSRLRIFCTNTWLPAAYSEGHKGSAFPLARPYDQVDACSYGLVCAPCWSDERDSTSPTRAIFSASAALQHQQTCEYFIIVCKWYLEKCRGVGDCQAQLTAGLTLWSFPVR